MISFDRTLKDELRGCFNRLDLALHLAWSDTRTRYRRSFLGPMWLVAGTAISVGGLGFVWSTIFEVDRAVFIPSLTAGLVVWLLISGSITESASVFYRSRQLLLNVPTSSLLVALQLLFRQVITFAHNFLVVAAVLAIYPSHVGVVSLLAIPGLLLVLINLLWVIQLVGYFGARFRDLEPLLGAIMQPLFFLTPVLFQPSQLGDKALIVAFNPLSYWLSLVRDPLVGTAPTASAWIISILLAIVGWSLALLMTMRRRHRLSYWIN